mmetsp:Transcript_9353/g.17271  ORF Transcript_9353/g.17271 Transcript_9353/m.17271 type:complete len:93 (-) Transcript_9353:62-340(-)
MQLRALALLAFVAGFGSAASVESIRGKSDLSLVLASKDLPKDANSLLGALPDGKDPVAAVADVLGSAVDKKVNGIEALIGANADNDDVESFS